MLDEIFTLGESMRTALEADDMDAFFALLDQRGALVEQLDARRAPAGDVLAGRADALARQHTALAVSIQAQQQRLAEALNTLAQVKQAKDRYGKRRAAPTRILNKNLCG